MVELRSSWLNVFKSICMFECAGWVPSGRRQRNLARRNIFSETDEEPEAFPQPFLEQELERQAPEPEALAQATEGAGQCPEAEAAPDGEADVLEPDGGRKYKYMYYKRGNVFGIRQSFFAKKQIFQIGGLKVAKAFALAIVHKAIARLESGSSEEAVKLWARSEVLNARA